MGDSGFCQRRGRAAIVTGVNTVQHETQSSSATPPAGNGLPLRGLAMVLLAVGVLLALWGVYAVTQGSDAKKDAQPAGPATVTSIVAPSTAAPAAPSTAATSPSATPSPEQAAPPAPAAPRPEQLEVSVLNNSTIGGWAARTAADARAAGFPVIHDGNLDGQVYTAPRSTVFFHPGNPEVEQKAHELADRFAGGHAVAIEDTLPGEIKDAPGMTLVLVQ